MDRNSLVSIRDATASDKNFIFATWLRGLRYGNDWFALIEPTAYYASYNNFIHGLLTKPGTVVKVACLLDDPDVVLGYAVYEGPVLHWVFVKKAWRGIGLAKSLVPNNTKVVSHLTVLGRNILKKHPQVQFNPFSTA